MSFFRPHTVRRARLAAAVSAIALAAACATAPTPEEIHARNWQVAITADAPPAYEVYLLQHPDGPYAATARNRIAELNAEERAAWEETLRINTEEAYADFAYRYAWGPHRVRAEALRDERAAPRLAAEEAAAWSDARREDIIPAYETFLAQWPDGANAGKAQARLDELWRTDEGVYLRAVRSGSPAQLEDFIRYYSDSDFVPDARRELELFRIRDDESWRRALSRDSSTATTTTCRKTPSAHGAAKPRTRSSRCATATTRRGSTPSASIPTTDTTTTGAPIRGAAGMSMRAAGSTTSAVPAAAATAMAAATIATTTTVATIATATTATAAATAAVAVEVPAAATRLRPARRPARHPVRRLHRLPLRRHRRLRRRHRAVSPASTGRPPAPTAAPCRSRRSGRYIAVFSCFSCVAPVIDACTRNVSALCWLNVRAPLRSGRSR